MDIVLQGNIDQATPEVIKNCLAASFVDRVIVSCWTTCQTDHLMQNRVLIVKSEDVENPGIGNRNRQIKSSLVGLFHTQTSDVAKLRNDQIISVSSLELMHEFYQTHKEPPIIFVAGDFFPLPFHPRDHTFFGTRYNLIELFNIPYDPQPPVFGERYSEFTRAEAYLGMHYYAKRDKRAAAMAAEPQKYIVDNAPCYLEAKQLTTELRDKVFKVFPRIELSWPKHNLPHYPYHSQQVWERWAN